jgi:hypothetical protein
MLAVGLLLAGLEKSNSGSDVWANVGATALWLASCCLVLALLIGALRGLAPRDAPSQGPRPAGGASGKQQ